MLENIAAILGTVVTPCLLLLAALVLLPTVRLHRVLAPRALLRALTTRAPNATVSPMRALSVALAGTLGVGNITGVASALLSGGPGAIVWMWIGALLVLAVKYAEVTLAVRYRRADGHGHYGGAMYYIRDGLAARLGKRASTRLGGAFALLCCANALVTGDLVQASAVAGVLPATWRTGGGILLALAVLGAICFGVRRIEAITAKLIPALTLGYIVLTVGILLRFRTDLPRILSDIVTSAFAPRAVFGGAVGFSVREAMRFGVMRGIFSNEAGCGTSPTAHAAADTDSPARQATLGVVEVLFDTLILCTLTAFCLLIGAERFGILPWKTDADAAAVTLSAFSALAGGGAATAVRVSIVLFAYATILAQLYYGTIALGYLTPNKKPRLLYAVITAAVAFLGTQIASPTVWLLADVVIGGMTAVNCVVLILLRRDVQPPPRL